MRTVFSKTIPIEISAKFIIFGARQVYAKPHRKTNTKDQTRCQKSDMGNEVRQVLKHNS